MLTKGDTYRFKGDNGCIELEDSDGHELSLPTESSIYLFDSINQVRYIRDAVTIRENDSILCIMTNPIILGVPEIYYPDEHTIIYDDQCDVIQTLFTHLSRYEALFIHFIIIPTNLRNEFIAIKVMMTLFTNFVKQSICVFSGSVYESPHMRINREIGLKLIFGIDSSNDIIKLSKQCEQLTINESKRSISVLCKDSVIASYTYKIIREEEPE